MCDDLGVGRGRERVAFVEQLFLESQVVLDHAVVGQRQNRMLGRAAEMRMRVGFARHAVRGPAGVADARRARQRASRHSLGQGVDPADRLDDVETGHRPTSVAIPALS